MESMTNSQEVLTPPAAAAAPRAALYVDGFNLYHPIRDMGQPHLKWACLWRLGQLICAKGGQELVKVVFCTAVPKSAQGEGKRDRHLRFNAAQKARGVEIITGHYVPEAVQIDGVPTGQTKWTEKQTDINVALELLFDGADDRYDVAFLLSADTDQVATARVFADRLAPLGKTLVGVAPPGRAVPTGYSQYGIKGLTLSAYQIERCVMPAIVQGAEKPIMRPPEYAPPEGWQHPDDRPKVVPKQKAAWGKAVGTGDVA